MPTINQDPILDVGFDRAGDETSDEPFDRTAFARRAIDLVEPRRTTVAICEGAARMRIESGPIWGRRDERWALLAIPARASRRAIALAVAHLADARRAYALDVLMEEALSRQGASPPVAVGAANERGP